MVKFSQVEPGYLALIISHKFSIAVQGTVFLPSKVNVSCHRIPLTNQESKITISFDISPVAPYLISCSLTPPDNSQPIQCSVKESRQSGQYNVVFTPVTRGLHQLHVKVCDIETVRTIQCSLHSCY